MPPALILLALLAIGVPSALRAAFGRPRFQLAAVGASAVAVLVAQALGELVRSRVAVIGDTQAGLALIGALAACALVTMVERRAGTARPRS
jgi:hypothetical protein